LTQLDLLDQCLAAANIDQSLPTLILSEVVLTYLDPQGYVPSGGVVPQRFISPMIYVVDDL